VGNRKPRRTDTLNGTYQGTQQLAGVWQRFATAQGPMRVMSGLAVEGANPLAGGVAGAHVTPAAVSRCGDAAGLVTLR